MAHDEEYMQLAIDHARWGMERGHGGPFGAVVARDGELLAEGWNQVLRLSDPTAHAEITAIREATRTQGHPWLDGDGVTLYSSCAPCPMCLASALWARVPRVVYAATAEDAQEIGFDDRAFAEALGVRLQGQIIVVEHAVAFRQRAREVMQLWPRYGQTY